MAGRSGEKKEGERVKEEKEKRGCDEREEGEDER